MRQRLGAVLDILRHGNTRCPITVAIYGDWDTGKTSAMRWLESQLREWNKLDVRARGRNWLMPKAPPGFIALLCHQKPQSYQKTRSQFMRGRSYLQRTVVEL